jgi:hypothetical protein
LAGRGTITVRLLVPPFRRNGASKSTTAATGMIT